MSRLPDVIAQEAGRRWNSFTEALTARGLQPPPAGRAASALRTGFALSLYVGRQCIRRPEMALDLIHGGDLVRRYALSDWESGIRRHLPGDLPKEGDDPAGLPDTLGESGFHEVLRRFRHREMVRIAVRDLAGLADLAETLADLSALADQCIRLALDFLHGRMARDWGTPVDGQGRPQRLVVLGMGKLGARELNFSSDVDLVFAYPSEGRTADGIRATSNEDFFVRLSRKLIQAIGANTDDGFVFRVDTRLRPFGDAGPLAMSFDRMVDYYQVHGREWERYALIKARVVADDPPAGRRLLAELKPFVFRRYLDYNTFDALRDMKGRIAAEVRTKGLQHNIKLGPGGIRAVEFFGQMFQLLRGGVQPELQARPILTILARLADRDLIPARTETELREAYIFLRRTENRIQAHADRQRHDLPTAEEEKAALAAAMGFAHWQAFLDGLNRHRARVQFHFDALLKTTDDEAAPRPETELEALNRAWRPNVPEEEARAILQEAGFGDPPKALQLIRDLREDRAIGAMGPEGMERFHRIMPLLLRESAGADRPQLVLGRLFDLIKSICRRTAYLSLLCEYPHTLENLVRLFEASPWIAALLNRHPVLLDELLDPRTLFRPPKRPELEREIRARLDNIPFEDLEHQMEVLRIFKQVNLLRVAASDITDVLPLMKVSDHLTDLAEVVLDQVVQLCWRHLTEKHGAPACRLDGRPCGTGFAVIAYGKLGGWELGYRSDLDLVFLHAAAPGRTAGGARPIDNAQFFARLGQRVLHLLTAHTPAGILYEADMRLRPSGDSGMLVCHINGFRDYQRKEAWTWEHQALIRARAIIGDRTLKEKFEGIRLETLSLPRNAAKLRAEVVEMREKLRRAQKDESEKVFDIKQGPGGIVDIEFLVQYLLLRHTHRHPDIARWTDNVRQLQALAENGIIAADDAFGLRRAYLVLRAMGHRLNLKGLPAHTAEDRFGGARAFVRHCWKEILEVESSP